jgi:hypothetical protein
LKQSGYEENKPSHKPVGVNDDKLECNISRAKSRVLEISLCNDFDYFVTLTLDRKKYERKDLEKFKKDLGIFIKNYNRNYKTKIKYVLVPEQHKDGAWHMHGLLKGMDETHLVMFDKIPEAPLKLKGKDYYNWTKYADKFGFCSLGKIKNREAAAKYITKYISKDIAKSVKELGAHLYYCSKGLKQAQVIKKGTLISASVPFQFENDYVKISTFSDSKIADLIIT